MSKNIPSVSGRLIVLARLLLLLFATGAVAAAVFVTVQEHRESATYACPMHPEVTGHARGTCPICHMALEPKAQPREPATVAIDNLRKHAIIDRVRKRSLLFDSRELRAPASVGDDGVVTALYYDDQLAALEPAEAATFSPAPDVAIPVRRTADEPVRWDRSTSRVRFRIEKGGAAAAGKWGWVDVPRKSRDVLTVPASAILQSPEGPYVIVPAGGYRFEKRPIRIGETFAKDGFAVVLSGLRLHEPVVAKASFFLDADRRLAEEGAP